MWSGRNTVKGGKTYWKALERKIEIRIKKEEDYIGVNGIRIIKEFKKEWKEI